MCSPTLGSFGLGAQVIGGVGQTYAAYRKSAGEKMGYDYQSRVARNNEQLSEWQAQDALLRGKFTQNKIQLKGAQVRGSQEASFASRNIALNEGSALNILADTEFLKTRDVNIADDNANKEAWALRNQATGYRSNADFLQYRAGAQNPFLDAAGTALTSGGRVAMSWYKMRTNNDKSYGMGEE